MGRSRRRSHSSARRHRPADDEIVHAAEHAPAGSALEDADDEPRRTLLLRPDRAGHPDRAGRLMELVVPDLDGALGTTGAGTAVEAAAAARAAPAAARVAAAGAVAHPDTGGAGGPAQWSVRRFLVKCFRAFRAQDDDHYHRRPHGREGHANPRRAPPLDGRTTHRIKRGSDSSAERFPFSLMSNAFPVTPPTPCGSTLRLDPQYAAGVVADPDLIRSQPRAGSESRRPAGGRRYGPCAD